MTPKMKLPEDGFTTERQAQVVHQLQGLLRALVQLVQVRRQLLGRVVLASSAGNLPDATVNVGDGTLGGLKR